MGGEHLAYKSCHRFIQGIYIKHTLLKTPTGSLNIWRIVAVDSHSIAGEIFNSISSVIHICLKRYFVWGAPESKVNFNMQSRLRSCRGHFEKLKANVNNFKNRKYQCFFRKEFIFFHYNIQTEFKKITKRISINAATKNM